MRISLEIPTEIKNIEQIPEQKIDKSPVERGIIQQEITNEFNPTTIRRKVWHEIFKSGR